MDKFDFGPQSAMFGVLRNPFEEGTVEHDRWNEQQTKAKALSRSYPSFIWLDDIDNDVSDSGDRMFRIG